MRAPLRKQTKLIGERWLLTGNDEEGHSNTAGRSGLNHREDLAPSCQEPNKSGVKLGSDNGENRKDSGNLENLNKLTNANMTSKTVANKKGVTVVENKKKKNI